MFASVLDDFDPRYWSRTAIAVVVVVSVAVGGGTAWLLVELLSRIAWFLLHLVLAWLMPPHVVLAILPTPPLQAVVSDRYAAVRSTVEDSVALDDLGDPDWDPTPDVVMSLDEVRRPGEQPEDLATLEVGMLALLGDFRGDDLSRTELFEGSVEGGVLAMIGGMGEGATISNVWGDGPGVALGDLQAEGGGSLTGRGGGSGGTGLGGFGTLGGVQGGVEGGIVGGVVGGVEGGVVGGSISTVARPARVISRGPFDTTGLSPGDARRCTVRVHLDASAAIQNVRFMGCPEALRGTVESSVRASTFEAALDGAGSPTAGHVSLTYVIEG